MSSMPKLKIADYFPSISSLDSITVNNFALAHESSCITSVKPPEGLCKERYERVTVKLKVYCNGWMHVTE